MTSDHPNGSGPERLHLVVPGAIASVPLARRAVTRWLRSCVPAATEADRAAVRLAVTESVANAVEHAGPGEVTVTGGYADGAIRTRVRDRGSGDGPWATAGRGSGWPLPDAERGRGLLLVAAVVDELEVLRTGTGTTVSFLRRVGSPPGGR